MSLATKQIITALEEQIETLESLGQPVQEQKKMLARLKAKADPVWRALGGEPDNHPLL